MSNKTFDFLKYMAQVFIPALTVFVGVVLKCFNVPCTDIVITIMTAFDAFLGSLLQIESKKYNACNDELEFISIDEDADDGK